MNSHNESINKKSDSFPVTVKLSTEELMEHNRFLLEICPTGSLTTASDLFKLMSVFAKERRIMMYLIQTHCQSGSACDKDIKENMLQKHTLIWTVCYALTTEDVSNRDLDEGHINKAISNLQKDNHYSSSYLIESLQGILLARNVKKHNRDFFSKAKCYFNLSKVYWSNVDLIEANFSYSNLRKIILTSAKLSRALINNAILTESRLDHADMSDANATEADLSESSLCETNLSGSTFCRANLSKANMSKAIMARVNFSGANLHKTKFIIAELTDVITSFVIDDKELQISSKKVLLERLNSLLAVVGEQEDEETKKTLKLALYDNLDDVINNMIEQKKVEEKKSMPYAYSVIDLVRSHELFKDYEWKPSDPRKLDNGRMVSALLNNLDDISTKWQDKFIVQDSSTTSDEEEFNCKKPTISSQKSTLFHSANYLNTFAFPSPKTSPGLSVVNPSHLETLDVKISNPSNALYNFGKLHISGLSHFNNDLIKAERSYKVFIEESNDESLKWNTMKNLGCLYVKMYYSYFLQENYSDNYDKVVHYLINALQTLTSYSLASLKPVTYDGWLEDVMTIAVNKKDNDLIRLTVKTACACYHTNDKIVQRFLSHLNGEEIDFNEDEKNWLKKEYVLGKWIAKLPAEETKILTSEGVSLVCSRKLSL